MAVARLSLPRYPVFLGGFKVLVPFFGGFKVEDHEERARLFLFHVGGSPKNKSASPRCLVVWSPVVW